VQTLFPKKGAVPAGVVSEECRSASGQRELVTSSAFVPGDPGGFETTQGARIFPYILSMPHGRQRLSKEISDLGNPPRNARCGDRRRSASRSLVIRGKNEYSLAGSIHKAG